MVDSPRHLWYPNSFSTVIAWMSLCLLLPAWTQTLVAPSRQATLACAGLFGLTAAVGLRPLEIARTWLLEQMECERSQSLELVHQARLAKFLDWSRSIRKTRPEDASRPGS